jgi:Fe-S oxidoreductase
MVVAMAPSAKETEFLASLAGRVQEILSDCTRCGRCVEVCPTAGPAGIDTSQPRAVVAQVLDILRGQGEPTSLGARWAETCTGSGRCIGACDDGVNPRFMLAMARLRLNEGRAVALRRTTGQAAFQKMAESVKVLSRLQLPADLVARITKPARADAGPPADVIMYLGCNVLKTPHIALLCLEVLDRLGTRYKVFGGPANCCGILQFRAGDATMAGRIARSTVSGFGGIGASRVLTWCPTCTIQLGEVALPGLESDFALEHVVPYIADRVDALRAHFTRAIYKRVALHEHPGVAGVTEGVLKILRAIPGLEVVELHQPRVGYMCNSLAPVPAYKRALHAQELAAAAAEGLDCLVGIYHACHRELCAHEATSPFKVVNFLELVGEAMDIERPDLFKRWKTMQDVDRVLVEVGPRIDALGLDLDAVRDVLLAHILGEQPLPLDHRTALSGLPPGPAGRFFPE